MNYPQRSIGTLNAYLFDAEVYVRKSNRYNIPCETTSCFSQGPTEHSKALGVYRLETNRDRVVDHNNISKVITVGHFNDFWLAK